MNRFINLINNQFYKPQIYNANFLSLTRFFKENQRSLFTAATPDLFHSTPLLCKEPMKKKKRQDPLITKAREDRKRRKLEKEIRKLEKNVLQFKPLEEMEVPSDLIKNLTTRTRPPPNLSDEEVMRRHRVSKNWACFKKKQHDEDMYMLERLVKSKRKALEELKKESEDLYFEAIQLDLNLIPFRCKGPLLTPPIEDYTDVDGDYKDITKSWD